MLEKYIEGLTEEKAIRMAMQSGGAKTRADAMAYLRKSIPKEPYYQTKIKKALEKRYPEAVTKKIAQGYYSQNGIPDIMFIKGGHYFGFEVKRPILGTLSGIQKQTITQIRDAGGTAEVISYPEEAIRVIEDYFGNE